MTPRAQFVFASHLINEHALVHEPLLINRSDDATTPELLPFGNTGRLSKSMIYAAVRNAGEVVGILSLQSYKPGYFGEPDRDLLQRLADTVAPALARCHAEKRSGAFSSLGLRLSTAITPAEAAQIIADTADELIGWDSCLVDIYWQEEGQVEEALNMDIVDGQRAQVRSDTVYRAPSDIAQRTMKEGPQLILRQSAQFDKKLAPFGDISRPSASLMYVPLRVAGQMTGILSIQSYEVNAYDEKDLKILMDLANHCSGALERTRVEQMMRNS